MRSMHTNCWTIPALLTLALMGALLCALPVDAADYDSTVTVASGEQFTLAETETIGGSLVVTGGEATVLGRLKGDAIVVDGSLTLGSTARLEGSLLTVRGVVERDPLAQVLGEQRSLTAVEFAQLMARATGEADTDEGKEEAEATAAEAPADEEVAEAEEQAQEPEDEEPAAEEEPAETQEAVEPEAIVREEHEDRAGFGETITIPADEVRVGDVASFGGPIIIDGTVRGNVASFAGSVTVHGTVDGSIATFGGGVTLTSGSRVTGEIATFGGALNKDPGATHEGQAAGFGEGLSRWAPSADEPVGGGGWLVATVLSLLVALLIAAVFPGSTRTIADGIVEQPGSAAAHGALTLLLIAPVCILLALTCVGLLLIPVVIIGVIVAGLMGNIGIDLILGRAISARLGWSVTSLLGLVAIGVVALQLVELTQFVPALGIVGFLVMLAILLFGIGGALMTGFGTTPDGTWITRRFGRRRSPKAVEPTVDLPACDDESEVTAELAEPPAAPDPAEWAPPSEPEAGEPGSDEPPPMD